MSSCTKCGYPVGNHPFRHSFAPVAAGGAGLATQPPAESPYVPIEQSAVAAERERCAKVAETYANSEHAVDRIIAEIRHPKGEA